MCPSIDLDALGHLMDVALGVSRMLLVLAIDTEGEDEALSGCYGIMGGALWDAAQALEGGGDDDERP